MRTGAALLTLALVGLLLAVSAPAWAAGPGEEVEGQAITIDKVPPVVKAAIEKESAGGTIKEIEKVVVEGKTIYEVDILKDKVETEIQISEDGKIIKKSVKTAEGKEEKE